MADNLVTREDLERHCAARHGPIDKSVDILFVKLDSFGNKMEAFADKVASRIDKLYFVVLGLLTTIIAALVVQYVIIEREQGRPIQIQIKPASDGAATVTQEGGRK